MNQRVLAVPLIAVAALAAYAFAESPAAKSSKPDDAAIARTRKVVHVLDDIYKQAIVIITDKYVHDSDDFPAGSAFVGLFNNVSKAGHHQVRLIDATGEPYEPENVAKSDFEKEGIKRLKAGAAYYEQVGEKDGKPVLYAITAVPVVMQKCVMCHEHYSKAKKGEAIGGISYVIGIE